MSDNNEVVLSKAISLFLEQHTPNTRKSYYYVLREFQQYIGPSRPLIDIHTALVLEFGRHFRRNPNIKSPATHNKYIKTLRTFLNWCIDCGLLEGKNPAKGLKYSVEYQAIDRTKAMPETDFSSLVDFAKWDHRAYALVLFLGDTGCRIGGAAGLKWSDVEFTNERATVTEKGKPPRFVGFRSEASRALLRWQQKQRSTRKGDYVFPTGGVRMTNDSLGQYFTRLCVHAHLKNWGPHSLRHRKGFQCSDARISPTLAAEILGDTVEIVLKYYYPRDWDRVKSAIDELGYAPENVYTGEIILPSKMGTG